MVLFAFQSYSFPINLQWGGPASVWLLQTWGLIGHPHLHKTIYLWTPMEAYKLFWYLETVQKSEAWTLGLLYLTCSYFSSTQEDKTLSSRSLEGVQHEHCILPSFCILPNSYSFPTVLSFSLSICSPLLVCSHTPESSFPQDKELLSPVWDPANSALIWFSSSWHCAGRGMLSDLKDVRVWVSRSTLVSRPTCNTNLHVLFSPLTFQSFIVETGVLLISCATYSLGFPLIWSSRSAIKVPSAFNLPKFCWHLLFAVACLVLNALMDIRLLYSLSVLFIWFLVPWGIINQ